MKEGDPFTFAPKVWRYLVERFAVDTVLDLGSGLGHSALYFHKLGAKVVAVDGLKENAESAAFPTVLHDLTIAPFYCKVDLLYCVEVVEHIDELFLPNLLQTFSGAKVVAMTHADVGQQGHHHVNCRDESYWVNQMNGAGFKLLPEDTYKVRALGNEDLAHHIARSGLVFHKG